MRAMLNRMIALIVLLQSAPGLSDGWLETMTRKKDCITAIENSQVHFDRVNRHWLTDRTSPFHVGSRFEQLLESHKHYRDEIDQFARRFNVNETSAEKILAQLKDLERSHQDVLASVADLNEADDAFVASVTAVDEAVAIVGDKYEELKKVCAETAAVDIDAAADVITEVRASLAEVEGYVTAAAQKRGELFLAVFHGLQARLTERYADLISVSVQDARNKIRTILLADLFLEKVRTWWQTAHGRKGLGEGLAGPWLQFHKPLAVMKRDLTEGESLEKELSGLSSGDGDLYRAVAGELGARISALRNAIKTLEDRGAQGTFDLQVATNARRKEIAGSLPPSCMAAIRSFDESAHPDGARPDDASRFNAEQKYIDVVLACRRKNP